MAKRPFHLSIVTPEGSRFDGQVTSLNFPGMDGYLGVWAHHAPMLAAMRPGILTIEVPDHPGVGRHFAVSTGFAEVSDNNAILLVDTCERAEDIDVDRAEQALERTKQHLQQLIRDQASAIEQEQAQLDKERAEARLRAAYIKHAAP